MTQSRSVPVHSIYNLSLPSGYDLMSIEPYPGNCSRFFEKSSFRDVERMMSTTHDLSAVDVHQWLRATHLLLIAAEDVKV
jgi:hypothetical protein